MVLDHIPCMRVMLWFWPIDLVSDYHTKTSFVLATKAHLSSTTGTSNESHGDLAAVYSVSLAPRVVKLESIKVLRSILFDQLCEKGFVP
jgi:hypothetical protein